MSVRLSLLAILNQGPCYGYQLRTEFHRRTGSTWLLNAGQVFTTLDRLERDGFVERLASDAERHDHFAITPTGRSEVASWLDSPVLRTSAARDELSMKLAVAATLPGVDLDRVFQVQRSAALANLQDLTATKRTTPEPETTEELAWLLVVDGLIFTAEAEIRWLDQSEARIARAAARGVGGPLALSAEAPKKGRPVKAQEAGA